MSRSNYWSAFAPVHSGDHWGSVLGNVQVPFKEPVKNLGLTLDYHLTMNDMSPLSLEHASSNYVIWHLFVDS